MMMTTTAHKRLPKLGFSSILAVLLSTLTFGALAGLPPWGDTPVVSAPAGFSYSVSQVRFEQPRWISDGAGKSPRYQAIKLEIRGHGFRPAATGPVIYLNGFSTMRTYIPEGGATLEAYFFDIDPEALKNAANRSGDWEMVYVPHTGAREAFRIPPEARSGETTTSPAIGHRIE